MPEASPDLDPQRLHRLRDLVTEALEMADAARLNMLGIHLHEALTNLTEIIDRDEGGKPVEK